MAEEKARAEYGVVVADSEASEKLRDELRAERGEVKDFDVGPALDEILARCREETGLEAPTPQEPLAWASMESAEEAMRRVRKG